MYSYTIRLKMKVSGQLKNPATSTPEEEPLIPIGPRSQSEEGKNLTLLGVPLCKRLLLMCRLYGMEILVI
jgi:hypothetical protein